jgi:ubiquinone biosynthesis protein Coq4
MKNVLSSMRVLFGRLRGAGAALRLLHDPDRLDEVFVLTDALPKHDEALHRIVEAVRGYPGAAAALAERRRTAVDPKTLRAMAPGTFGRAVASFIDDNGIDPTSLPSLESPNELAWVKAHLYETHDVWHVATGFTTDVAGELALQAFYAAQLPGRVPELLLAGGLLQAALWKQEDFRPRLAAIARGWVAGKRARPLFGVRWDTLWDVPLERVRAELALTGHLTHPTGPVEASH